jgi:hypothetical protein
MLEDKKCGGAIIELLGSLLADLVPHLTTVGTRLLGFRQVVQHRDARQVGWQFATAMASALANYRGGFKRFFDGGGHRRLRFGSRQQIGEEQELIGIDTFGAWAVDAAEQQIESMLDLFPVASLGVERHQEFGNHLLEQRGIVGQIIQTRQICGR